mmetsp:Transcript_2792/g.11081  ORF Transcript_2792/g.11081 Transcript_2792/m.11081 type:complete len:386 (+) Transcript_2792:1363-2520(+)
MGRTSETRHANMGVSFASLAPGPSHAPNSESGPTRWLAKSSMNARFDAYGAHDPKVTSPTALATPAGAASGKNAFGLELRSEDSGAARSTTGRPSSASGIAYPRVSTVFSPRRTIPAHGSRISNPNVTSGSAKTERRSFISRESGFVVSFSPGSASASDVVAASSEVFCFFLRLVVLVVASRAFPFPTGKSRRLVREAREARRQRPRHPALDLVRHHLQQRPVVELHRHPRVARQRKRELRVERLGQSFYIPRDGGVLQTQRFQVLGAFDAAAHESNLSVFPAVRLGATCLGHGDLHRGNQAAAPKKGRAQTHRRDLATAHDARAGDDVAGAPQLGQSVAVHRFRAAPETHVVDLRVARQRVGEASLSQPRVPVIEKRARGFFPL